MSKIRTKTVKLRKFVEDFNPVFSVNQNSYLNSTLFCNFCKKDILCRDRNCIELHINRRSHLEAVPKVAEKRQLTQNEFNRDLRTFYVFKYRLT